MSCDVHIHAHDQQVDRAKCLIPNNLVRTSIQFLIQHNQITDNIFADVSTPKFLHAI